MAKIYQKLRCFLREKLMELTTITAVNGSYIHWCRWLLYQQGFWPSLDRESKTPPSRIRFWYSRLSFVTWLYMTFIGFPMAAVSASGEPFVVQAEPIIFAIISGIGVAISGTYIYHSHLYQETVEAFEEMTERARHLPQQSHENLKSREKACSYIFYAIMAVGPFVMFLIFLMLPGMIIKRKFLIRAWYPYDEKAWPNYEITLALWMAWLVAGAFYICPASVLMIVLMLQAWSHLELLCHNLAVLSETALQRTSQKIESKFGLKQKRIRLFDKEVSDEMTLVLRSCVLHHQAVIRFVSRLGPAFDKIISQILLSFLIPSGLIIYSIQHSEHFTSESVLQLTSLFLVAMILLYIFLIADKISDQSEMVRESAFASDWIEAPESLKRSLRIVMSRSNQPLVITVTGGIPLSLDTARHAFFLTYKYYNFVIDSTSKSSATTNDDSLIYLAVPTT